ncbi:MAG: hypothetical protein QM831_45300 [Kofleriaceae bacterium]
MKTLAFVLMLAACGGGGNSDCKKLLANLGEEPTGKAMKECTDNIDKMKKDATMQCVIAAANKDEAKKCLQKDLDDANAAAAKANAAIKAADQAVQEAQDAEQRVKDLEAKAEALSKQVNDAVDELAKATTDAAREAAKTKLQGLQKQVEEMKEGVAAAKAGAAKAERAKGVHITKECMDNPLAKGCS